VPAKIHVIETLRKQPAAGLRIKPAAQLLRHRPRFSVYVPKRFFSFKRHGDLKIND
jgi:hypothetical protein